MSESDFSVFFLLITNEDWSNIGMKRWQAHSTYQMRANQKSQFELCTSDMWITWRCSFSVSLDCKLQSAVKVGLSHSQNKSVTSGIIRGLQEEQWAGSCCSSVLGGENSITCTNLHRVLGLPSCMLWDAVLVLKAIKLIKWLESISLFHSLGKISSLSEMDCEAV